MSKNPLKPASPFGIVPRAPGQAPAGLGAFGHGALDREEAPRGYLGQWVDNTRPMSEIPVVAGSPYGPVNAAARVLWESPLFDLRGDFTGSNTYGNTAVPIPRENLLGTHRALYLSVNASLNAVSRWAFAYVTRSAVVNPTEAVYDTWPVDITPDILAGANPASGVYRTLLKFPIYDPVRYWGLAFVGNVYVDATEIGDSSILIAGALH